MTTASQQMTQLFDNAIFLSTPNLERRVRSSDSDTSWLAASIAPESAAAVRDFIEIWLARNPGSTDDAIYAGYVRSGGKRSPQRVRTARAELSNPRVGAPRIHTTGIGVSDAGGKSQEWSVNG